MYNNQNSTYLKIEVAKPVTFETNKEMLYFHRKAVEKHDYEKVFIKY